MPLDPLGMSVLHMYILTHPHTLFCNPLAKILKETPEDFGQSIKHKL